MCNLVSKSVDLLEKNNHIKDNVYLRWIECHLKENFTLIYEI